MHKFSRISNETKSPSDLLEECGGDQAEGIKARKVRAEKAEIQPRSLNTETIDVTWVPLDLESTAPLLVSLIRK